MKKHQNNSEKCLTESSPSQSISSSKLQICSDACSTSSTSDSSITFTSTSTTESSCILNLDQLISNNCATTTTNANDNNDSKHDSDTGSTTVSLLSSSSSNSDLQNNLLDNLNDEPVVFVLSDTKSNNGNVNATFARQHSDDSTSSSGSSLSEDVEPNLSSFQRDYDGEVERLVDKAAKTIENKCIGFGFYQFISFLFISIAWSIGNGWYAYVSIFTAHVPKHNCTSVPLTSNNYTYSDDQCEIVDTYTNQSIQCKAWSYDQTQMKTTIISEYNFVCKRDHYFEVAYSIEQTGYIVGTLLFSILADRVGRKPVLVSVLCVVTCLGFIQFWITDFYVYMALGFVINFFASGLDSVCVPLVLEIVTTKQRTGFGIGMEYVWVLILTSLSGFVYLINTWRYLRLTIFAILGVLAVCSFWLVQESLTWLISTCKLDDALQIIERIAKFNGISKSKAYMIKKQKLLESFQYLAQYTEMVKNGFSTVATEKELLVKDPERGSKTLNVTQESRKIGIIAELMKYPKYRAYVLIMSLNWFATALIYDGLTYLNSFVGENIFISWTLLNIVELPAQLICHFSLSRYGRRLTTCISLVVCGITLMVTCLITSIEMLDGISYLKLIFYLIAKFSATQAYSAVILHSPEIFPTHLRSFGYGICLFSSKVTAVITPMISLYLSKKFYAWLPALIYGCISIFCGAVCLYVPETLNRPLPNSIEDVLKWPRHLTPEEKKFIKDTNRLNFQSFKRFIKCCKTKSGPTTEPAPLKKSSTPDTQNEILLNSVNS